MPDRLIPTSINRPSSNPPPPRSVFRRAPPLSRTIAIGDIHGCSKALRSLLEAIQPASDDTIVLLGDYVDRGPDSRGVVDELITLQSACKVVALRGNHDLMFNAVFRQGLDPDHWLKSGGQATLASYGGTLKRLPELHDHFFAKLQSYHETEQAIFVHAGYQHDLGMAEQSEQSLYWDHLSSPHPPPHASGKTVFVGHTPQGNGMPLDLGYLVCLDTYCFGGLWLTAMDVQTRELWQASYHGHMRRRPFQWLQDLWQRRRRNRC